MTKKNAVSKLLKRLFGNLARERTFLEMTRKTFSPEKTEMTSLAS